MCPRRQQQRTSKASSAVTLPELLDRPGWWSARIDIAEVDGGTDATDAMRASTT